VSTDVIGAANHLVLVGPMGVGKTTVGRLVAAQLGRPFRDSDVDLSAAGRNARDVAATEGVDALHVLEAETLLRSLAEPSPAVIAAAASVVEDARCRAALRPVFTVWLWAPAETLAERMRDGAHRRYLGDDVLVGITALAHRRDPVYREVADLTIDVGRLRPAQVAEAIVGRYEALHAAP
jgi:shikimate kinase